MISTLPKNEKEAAVIARSRQLTEFVWTPVRDVPTYTKAEGRIVLPAGVEVKGFPYASAEATDKFFTENVSFETFLSAIPNPHSKLYQPGHSAFNACNYGIVCNSFVRYTLGIEERFSTSHWFDIPGMKMVKPKGEYTVDDMRLCDVLHAFGEGRNHVSLITDILRNDDGEIVEVEISEAVRPYCKRRRFAPEDFYEKYKPFSLCRYEKFDEVPSFDTENDNLLWNSGIEKITPKITVDNGNKSNYLVGEEVVVSVFSEAKDTLEIYKNGEKIISQTVGARAIIPFKLEKGYYVAKLEGLGESVEFCVNQAEVSHNVEGDTITVCFDPCDKQSEVMHADFRKEGDGVAALSKIIKLTDEEKTNGKFSRKIPKDAKNFKVYYKNAYGIWTHPMKLI